MKKLLILLLVLGMASIASAALTWSTSSLTLDVDEIVTVQISSSDASAYGVWMWADESVVADVTAVSAYDAAGDNSAYTEDYLDYDGWYYLEAKDSDPESSPDIASGNHWDITIKGLAVGSLSVDSDDAGYAGANDILSITVVPEPAMIALLGLGGLFLRRRK